MLDSTSVHEQSSTIVKGTDTSGTILSKKETFFK